jgi:Flp pilus assembly protein TadG
MIRSPIKSTYKSPTSHRSAEDGAVAVEFVVVFPILLLMLFAVVEFGRFYSDSISVTHAAREAVRKVALFDAASAGSTASAAAAPVTVSIGAVTACTNTSTTPASVTVTNTFSFSYLFGATSFPITRTAVMRCGG